MILFPSKYLGDMAGDIYDMNKDYPEILKALGL